jgi:hypothetical protein
LRKDWDEGSVEVEDDPEQPVSKGMIRGTTRVDEVEEKEAWGDVDDADISAIGSCPRSR